MIYIYSYLKKRLLFYFPHYVNDHCENRHESWNKEHVSGGVYTFTFMLLADAFIQSVPRTHTHAFIEFVRMSRGCWSEHTEHNADRSVDLCPLRSGWRRSGSPGRSVSSRHRSGWRRWLTERSSAGIWRHGQRNHTHPRGGANIYTKQKIIIKLFLIYSS